MSCRRSRAASVAARRSGAQAPSPLCSVARVDTNRALLLIADIGGYTEYMRGHRTILGHAEAATTRLLGKVVDAARTFDLIEIEGDAAFLSRDADKLDDAAARALIADVAV